MGQKAEWTEGNWYVAERTKWAPDSVRFVRTRGDKSGVIGVTNDRDAPLIAVAPELVEALEGLLGYVGGWDDNSNPHICRAREVLRKAREECRDQSEE